MKPFNLAVACKEVRMAVLLIRLRRLALLEDESGDGEANVSEVILDNVDAAHRTVLHARPLVGPPSSKTLPSEDPQAMASRTAGFERPGTGCE